MTARGIQRADKADPGESGCTAARKPPDVVANGGSLKPSLPAAVRTGMHTAVNEGE